MKLAVLLHDDIVFKGFIKRLRVDSSFSPLFDSLKLSKSSSDLIIGILPSDSTSENNGIQKDSIGSLCKVISLIKFNGDSSTQFVIVVDVIGRFRVKKVVKSKPWIEADVIDNIEEAISEKDDDLSEKIANLRELGKSYVNLLSKQLLDQDITNHVLQTIETIAPDNLADYITSMLEIPRSEKLTLLTTLSSKERINILIPIITRVNENISTVRKFFSKSGIFKRLNSKPTSVNAPPNPTSESDEFAKLSAKIEELPDDVKSIANNELARLKQLNPANAEYQVLKTYLDTLTSLPWAKFTPTEINLTVARNQLDKDHYGLKKVKSRILEFLAVRKLKGDLKGFILCLVGPPGTGKTSLGKSIADAVGRKFVRLSLGGVRDEAEIRGHRRTYVGAMMGKILNALKTCGVNNPVILLDEIDKLGNDHRGDPAAALLEVLDPEQNHTFTDHYLNIPFDLSNILFIATANDADTIPAPLLDRMEQVQIPSYTLEEKAHIGYNHLLPKQLERNGLSPDQVQISLEIMQNIVLNYTHEAGVRSLNREIGAICRYCAVNIAQQMESANTQVGGDDLLQIQTEKTRFVIDMEKVESILGPKRHHENTEQQQIPGTATGLAWTSTGGEILIVEATQMKGKGQLQLTGKLGDVIKESAQIAISWIRANAERLVLNNVGGGEIRSSGSSGGLLDNVDLHLHFPAGAVPKDGPSAGITILISLLSLFTGRTVLPHTAMTGEITLGGKILPVGGIKEKILAAHRGKIKRVILPVQNKKDVVADIKNVLEQSDFEIIYVKNVFEAVVAAFGQDSGIFLDGENGIDTGKFGSLGIFGVEYRAKL